jgi:hypothetical protein
MIRWVQLHSPWGALATDAVTEASPTLESQPKIEELVQA